VLDVTVAGAGLVLLAPVLLLIAAAVKLSSRGPVLFRQVRVGQGGQPITVTKFRTMRVGHGGPEFTPNGDRRVTAVGRTLRFSGLDELPQLVNVLRGDMTLVGPRPETPALAAQYPPECRAVFQFRPGLTGPAQVRLRDLDVLGDGDADLQARYLGEVVRRRSQLNLEYLAAPTLARTVGVLAETAWYLLRPARAAAGALAARLGPRRRA
jgi:lipopolysaccharide/colanic/teichoic acid biosynthesis glycosyltransferase